MKNLYLLLLLTLGLFSLSSARDAGQIKGTVLDNNGTELPFATVLLHSAGDSSLVKAGYTKENGDFEFIQIPAGDYFLKITFTGLATYTSEPFNLPQNGEKDFGKIQLEEPEAMLEEVQIVAEKPVLQVDPDKTIFNVEGNPNAVGVDALELLRKAPGVVIDNNDNVMLQGKNGVLIYIDGKRTYLSQEDLVNMLRSMQSSEIEALEIITNPSSKYDAEGNAGIINIKLKKDKNLGMNGSVNLGYGVQRFGKYNGGVSANYRNKKLNAFGSYQANVGRSWNFMDLTRTQDGLVYETDFDNYRNFQNHNYRGGLDLFLNKKHTVGFLFQGFENRGDVLSVSSVPIRPVNSETYTTILQSDNETDQSRSNYRGNLNYAFDNGEGQSVNIDLDYGKFVGDAYMWQPNYYLDPETNDVQQTNIYTNRTPTSIDIGTFKLDHERPLLGGTLGAGLKTSYVITNNTFDFFDVVNGEEVLNTDRSNTFDYTENINAGYLNYKKQIKKFGIQAGLRAEQTNSLGELTSTQNNAEDRVERHYLNFFPSAGVTYQLNQKHMFRLSYSRRINRPDYQDLNPFEYKINELSYRKGNPFLRPKYTHNIELNHTFQYTINTSISYSYITDFFTELTDTLADGSTFLTTENLSNRQVLSANLGAPFSPAKWMSCYVNLNVSHSRNFSDFGEGKVVDIERTVGSFYGQTSIKLPWDLSVQASGWYSTPSVWGANYLTKSMWSVEGGVMKRFMDGRASLKLAVGDIFWTQQWRADMQFGALTTTGRGGWESRQFRANFTYNFGNQQMKASRKRKTGLEDENERIKNS